MLGILREVCSPEGGQFHEQRVMVHFDDAPIHSTKETQECLTNLRFKRMANPPCSPNLALCDFFLVGVKGNFAGSHFECIEEILLAVEAFLRRISVGFL
jgi:hypothetical protein